MNCYSHSEIEGPHLYMETNCPTSLYGAGYDVKDYQRQMWIFFQIGSYRSAAKLFPVHQFKELAVGSLNDNTCTLVILWSNNLILVNSVQAKKIPCIFPFIYIDTTLKILRCILMYFKTYCIICLRWDLRGNGRRLDFLDI